MKIVINRCFGGFGLPEGFMKMYDMTYDAVYDDNIRSDDRLIAYLENNKISTVDYATQLEIVEIPKEATDYRIIEYDGMETVLAVINGKIVNL